MVTPYATRAVGGARETLIARSPIRAGDVSVWLATPPQSAATAVAHYGHLLSPHELRHAHTFRFDANRSEQVVSRALVRIALSHHDGRPREAWRFERTPHGRPYPLEADGLDFNLTNHPTLVACAVARGSVGIDVEPLHRATTILEISERVFSPIERAELARLSQSAARSRAVSLWTAKEAYIKARGLGLTIPLHSFSIRFDDRMWIEVHDGSGCGVHWLLGSFDCNAHRISIALPVTTATELAVTWHWLVGASPISPAST